MPLDKDERAELAAHKSNVVAEVKGITDAAIAHVEKVVAPFAPLAQKVDATAVKVDALEKETKDQTPILKDLATEAKRAKKARIAARNERISRSALDKEKRERDAAWVKWRKRVAGAAAILVVLGEAYRLFFGDAPEPKKKHKHAIEEAP